MTTDGYRRPIPAHSSGWLREWHRPLERGRDDGDGRPELPPSLVIGIEGHKGAGKTALSVALALDLGLQGFSLVSNTPLRLPERVPVRITDRGLDAVLDICLDLVGARDTVLLIDEAHVSLAASSGVSNLSKLLAAAVGQSRKIRLWVIYTTLSVHWVESRLRAMTDLVARVTDAAVLGMTTRRGEMALVQWYDHSGIVTGRVGGYPMGETLFRVRRVWDLFDTHAVRDPSEALARVVFQERPVAQVALGGTGDTRIPPDHRSAPAPQMAIRSPHTRSEAVLEASARHRGEIDDIYRFLEERTERAPDASVQASTLYHAYMEWAQQEEAEPVGPRRFGEALLNLGLTRYASDGKRYYRGLRLR
jgi:hypothetical protein